MSEVSHSSLYVLPEDIQSIDPSIVILRTEWNEDIVGRLEQGCVALLDRHGFTRHHTLVVPGAFEIPFAIKHYWEQMRYRDERPHAFIALACIIRGDTPHFDFVSKGVTDGIVQLNLQLPVPTIFGVLTVDNLQQAEERVGGRHGHKGEEAAITALKMIALQQQINYKKL